MNKTIIYIDGQNFLYKVSERLLSANLISDKQDICSLDISGLFKPIFHNVNLEIRYYGVRRIYHKTDLNDGIQEKAKRFSDSLRRLKNYLRKNGVIYVPKGSLKIRTDEKCKKCGFIEQHFQEKGVDVGLAIDLIHDVASGQCDQIVLVSSDTDLLPALQVAKNYGTKITYVSFSGQATVSLVKASNEHIVLRDELVRKAYISSLN